MKTDRPIKEFLAEAEDVLEAANQTLLALEREFATGRHNPDLVNALFRSLHTLKGISGMFGLQSTADLSHGLESLLDEIRLGKLALGRDALDAMFSAIGLLGRLVQQAGKRQRAEDVSSALGEIERLLKSGTAAGADHSLLDRIALDRSITQVLTEYEEHRLKENIRERKNLYILKASFDLDNFEKEIKRLNALIKKHGEIICTLPTAGKDGAGIGFHIVVGTEETIDLLKSAINMPGVSIDRAPYIEELKTGEAKPDIATIKSVSNTVRVDISKLDSLMNIVGELHLAKNVIGLLSRDLRIAQGFTGLAVDLHKAHRNLERKLNEMQEGILDIRMVPLGQIFTRLAQAVRNYARDAAKEIDLQLEGEETELDKLMIEDLADPLMHLIRNAIDHGIELPEARKRLGKPEHGLVRLSAFPKGNRVAITVEDDGAGIDPKRILSRALEKGQVGPDHGLDAVADRKAILDLIFLPGFTTSEKVTELSGRGVGMDVVKKNVSKLSGMIDIETEPGMGAKFILSLPITLAIIKALIVEAGGQAFAVPLSSVLEILKTDADRIETVETREVMAVRDETVPLLRLTQAFSIPEGEAADSPHVILVGLAERRLGIVVDRIRGQQEIVIKPLGKRLSSTPGIAGATELGDKRVVLVLDVEALIGGSLKKTAHPVKV